MSESAFKKGDRVAWHPVFASQHAAGSIVREDAVTANAPNRVFGLVVDVVNDAGTHFAVELEDGRTLVLTNDELVKVSKE